jgi:hypothetical protein
MTLKWNFFAMKNVETFFRLGRKLSFVRRLSGRQGDQIGRIFASWVYCLLWAFFEKLLN